MRVLISGAGIAGSTLAWFLSKAGKRVTVLEHTQSILPHGQNIDMTGSAITIMKKMGLLDEVRRNNTTEKGTRFIDPKGRAFAPFPVKKGTQASFTSEFEILRGDLAKILYEASKEQPNVNYMFGTTIKQILSNDDTSVKVQLSNGEVQEFDLLVAADGQWSRTRKQCFSPEAVTVVDKGMTAVYWTVPRLPSDNEWWNVFIALRSRIITLRPDPHGTIRAMISCMPGNDVQKKAWLEASKSDRQTQIDFLRREFADAGWQMPRLFESMDQAPDFYFHTIQQIKMSKWSESRVICLGDAAFAPSPLTGFGTSLAINAAYILAGELSKLEDGENPTKALENYETLFRPFVEEKQNVPRFVPDIAHPETAWKRWALQTFVSVLARIAATPWIVDRLGGDDSDHFPLPDYPKFDDKGSQ